MITVSITEAEIQAHEPCPAGMAVFRSCMTPSPKGRMRVRVVWTPLHTAWLASVYPGYHSWLVRKGLIPGADLAGADLSKADLSRADLAGANLAGADLSRAYRGYSDPAPAGWRTLATGYLKRDT